MVKVISINSFPKNISNDMIENRILVSREDGYVTIIDEKSLHSEDFMTHVCGTIDTVCTVKTNHKYVVTWDKGLLVYRNFKSEYSF